MTLTGLLMATSVTGLIVSTLALPSFVAGYMGAYGAEGEKIGLVVFIILLFTNVPTAVVVESQKAPEFLQRSPRGS
jgi:hypothetical protein